MAYQTGISNNNNQTAMVTGAQLATIASYNHKE